MAISQTFVRDEIFNKITNNRPHTSKLIIEPINSSILLHTLSIYSFMLSEAKGCSIVFLANEKNYEYLNKNLSRYFSNYKIHVLSKIGIVEKAWFLFVSVLHYLRFCLYGHYLKYEKDGVNYGDIVYDTYLKNSQMATMHKFDPDLIKNFYRIFCEYSRYEKSLKIINPKYALVSHTVGITSGLLLKIATQKGVNVYATFGQAFGTLFLASDTSGQKVYGYTPTDEDITRITDQSDEKFREMFEIICTKHFNGDFNRDASLAFTNKLYTVRDEFCHDLKLDGKNKNVIITLHAFTDYPNSHFNGMLYDDYFDWFIETLEYISGINNVNWIIKQHPSIVFYPSKDVNMKEIIAKYTAENIIFLGTDNLIDTRSFAHVADAVITCAGSSGFELPAIGKLQSLIAGDCPYANVGFAIKPDTKEQYKDALIDLANGEKLSEGKHKDAMATFLFVHRLARVSMLAIPSLPNKEHINTGYSEKYFDIVLNTVSVNQKKIISEIERYIQKINDKDFNALRTSPKEFWEDYSQADA